ncbi:hypothetical protein QVA66_06980 [Staphylococcus chromogenes]|nr:hypothetical protein [Staphylococcus chromogenes]
MAVWGDFEIFNTATQPAEALDFWVAYHRGAYVRVHGTFVAHREQWNALNPWDRDRIRTLVVAAASPTTVLVGRSACRYWDLPLASHEGIVELGYDGGRTIKSRKLWPPGVAYRRITLPASHLCEKDGLRITSVERSVLDFCRWHPFGESLALVEGYLRKFPRRDTWLLQKKLAEMGRVPGVRACRKVLKYASRGSQSVAESLAKALLIENSLGSVRRQQVEVYGPDWRYFIDFVIDDWLAIEIDGDVKYTGPGLDKVLLNERKREKRIRNAGYTLLRFDWKQLHNGEFEKLVRLALENPRPRFPA